MEEFLTAPEFESVSKKLKGGIIKDRTALKVHRIPSLDDYMFPRIEGQVLQEHDFKMQTLLLRHSDEGLLKMSEDEHLLHRDLTGQIRKTSCTVQPGL